MKTFDHSRKEFTPYGFNCELWTPREMKRPDRHNEIELNLLKSGALCYLMNGDLIEIHRGRLAVFWASIPHQIIRFEDKAPYWVATIPLADFLQWKLPDPFVQEVMNGFVVEEPGRKRADLDFLLFEKWAEDLGSGEDELADLVELEMEVRLRRMAGVYGRENGAEHPVIMSMDLGSGGLSKVEQMASFISQRFRDPIQIPDIARSVRLHPDYAASLFRKTFGTTLNHYLVRHRVSHAQRLLATSDLKIVDIALESGFKTISRFNSAFKAICDCTPREYRARHWIAKID